MAESYDSSLKKLINQKAIQRVGGFGDKSNLELRKKRSEDFKKLIQKWYLRCRGRSESEFVDFYVQTLMSSMNKNKEGTPVGVIPESDLKAIYNDLQNNPRRLMLKTISALLMIRDSTRPKKDPNNSKSEEVDQEESDSEEEEDGESEDSEDED